MRPRSAAAPRATTDQEKEADLLNPPERRTRDISSTVTVDELTHFFRFPLSRLGYQIRGCGSNGP